MAGHVCYACRTGLCMTRPGRDILRLNRLSADFSGGIRNGWELSGGLLTCLMPVSSYGIDGWYPDTFWHMRILLVVHCNVFGMCL